MNAVAKVKVLETEVQTLKVDLTSAKYQLTQAQRELESAKLQLEFFKRHFFGEKSEKRHSPELEAAQGNLFADQTGADLEPNNPLSKALKSVLSQ